MGPLVSREFLVIVHLLILSNVYFLKCYLDLRLVDNIPKGKDEIHVNFLSSLSPDSCSRVDIKSCSVLSSDPYYLVC